MARRKQTRGSCVFCGREMTKGGLSRHLKSCTKRTEAIETANLQIKNGPVQPIYHLQLQDVWGGSYWLHLEIQGEATLKALDDYLRAIWLECCGHLSQFSIGGWSGDEIPMNRKIKHVLTPGLTLTHIYDFGTPSETLIKAVDVRQGRPLTQHPIFLMARNKLPEVRCSECDKLARWWCTECWIEMGEWVPLCDRHAEEHRTEEHDNDEYGMSPFVNSPRMGMCGYYGPAEPPY